MILTAREFAHQFVKENRLDCEDERPSVEPRPEHFPLCDRLTDAIVRAIHQERERCMGWVSAMRMGQLDDIRSVQWGIRGAEEFSKDE